MHRPVSNNKNFITHTFAFIVAMTFLANNSLAAVETTDTEALRNRTKQEAQERARQQKAPSVNLQGEIPKAVPFQLPAAETPCFTVNKFVLEVPGNLSPAAQRYGASISIWDTFHFVLDFLEQYKGKCIGHKGINMIVKGVTAKILEHGYSTTRIGVPEQDMLSGTLKLTLVPGIIHELRFADPKTAGTWKNAFPTSNGKLLNLRDLEQGLEQMKRVTSQDVDLQIVPAKNLGESDVIISVKRTKPWKTVFSLDDSGAKGTGKTQAGLQFGWDNLLGINDLLNIGTSSDADRNNYMRGTQGYNLSYSAPYGYWTSTLSANESSYHQRIMGATTNFLSSGKTQNIELKINYLFYRDQFSKNSFQFRTGKRFSHSYIDNTEVLVQRRNTTLAEIAWVHKHNIGQAQLNATLAYRWGAPWFGAQSDPANLPGTSPRYRYKLETLDVSLVMPFSLGNRRLSYNGTFRAQNTNTALYATEWFSIGNRWTVRGFDGESALSAEKGFFLRNEISLPIPGTAQLTYVGLDFGEVYGDNTINLPGNKLAGIAAGIKGKLAQSMMYEAFASWALYKPQYYRTDTPAAGFNLIYQL